MRVIQEDKNKLIFSVYPTKYFLIVVIVYLIIIAFLAIYNPNTFFTSQYHPPRVVIDRNMGLLLYASMFIVLLIYLIMSYALPLRIVIDKGTRKLTYEDFTLYTTRFFLGYNKSPIDAAGEHVKFIDIDRLKKLRYTPATHHWSDTYFYFFEGTFTFIMDDDSSFSIKTGTYSLPRHKEAFRKIADYLEIPYEEEIVANSKTGVSKLISPNYKVINTMLIIMIVLVIIVGILFFLGLLSRNS